MEKRLGLVAAMSLAMAGPILFCLLAYDQRRFVEELLSADTLLPAAFAYDLTHFRDVMVWFQLPRVQSIVPDLLLYGLNQALTGDWRLAHLCFGLLSLLAVSVLAAAIIAQIVKCAFVEGALAFQLVLLPVLFLELHEPRQEGALHFSLFHPASHSGQCLLALGGAVLTWAAIRSRALLPAAMVALLSLCGSVSDKLFFVEFLLPALVTCGILAYFKIVSGKLVLAVAAVLLACVVVSWAADVLLPHQAYPGVDWPNVPSHVRAFLLSPFAELGPNAPWATLVCYGMPSLAALIVVIAALAADRAADAWAGDALRYYLLMAATSATASGATASLLYGKYWDYRYAQLLLWWPLIFSAAGVAFLLKRWRPALALGLAAVALFEIVLLSFYLSAGFHSPAALVWRDPTAECLLALKQSAGLRAGLSEYWLGLYLTAMTDWRLQVEPISPSGAAVYWGNDPRWFTHDIHDPAAPPDFNFIVVAHSDHAPELAVVSEASRTGNGLADYFGLPNARIRALYGEPDQVLACPEFSAHHAEIWTPPAEVWVYRNPQAMLETLIAHSPALKTAYRNAGGVRP